MTEQEEWKKLLRHTVGARENTPTKEHGYRNHYCAPIGSTAENHFLAMVAAGYAVTGEPNGTTRYFHATKEGCEFAGLSRAATKRALED